jgi:transposase InsO family protein
MFHSDQGTQYSSKVFIDYCSKNNITQSMGRKGNCWDNTQLLNESSCSYKSKYNFLRFARLQNDLQSFDSLISQP